MVLKMDEYKIKLLNLNLISINHEPDSPIYKLSLHIIDYLHEKHDSLGFLEAVCESLDDLYTGSSKFTGEKIVNPLHGFHESFYQKLLKEEVPEIVTSIFTKDEDFAEEIKNYIKKLFNEE